MSSVTNERDLFKPKPSKADITDQAAQTIIDDEAARREAKTARLRQARLEMEAKLAAAPAPAKPGRSNAAKKGSSPSS